MNLTSTSTKFLGTMTLLLWSCLAFAQSVCLLGDGATVGDLPQAEQNAYNWALNHYGADAAYVSFADVAANGLPATCRVAWFHWEDAADIPAGAAAAAGTVGDFVTNHGGGLLASGFATEYVVDIGATTVEPSEKIDKDPAGPDAAWGVRPLTGMENNPVFAGMTLETGWVDANWGGYRTVTETVEGREALNWWTGGAYPGTPIAGMPWWDPNNSDIPVIGRINSGNGATVTCTAPGYNWVNVDMSDAEDQANLQQLTVNMLGMVAGNPEIVMVQDAAAIDDLPDSEKNAYAWAAGKFGLKATYMSFADVAAMGLPASAKTVWYHDEDDEALPASGADAVTAIADFTKGGGKLFVSGFASDYVTTVGATTVGPNETIDKDPAGPDAAWGIKPLAGKEAHPIFEGIDPTTDWNDANWGGFRTVGADVEGHEVIRWWTGGSFPGEALAVMPWWDVNNNELPIVGTLDWDDGTVVVVSGPGFQWLTAPNNDATAQANLEKFTCNVLTYDASGEVEIILVGDAPTVDDLPQGEKNAYGWALDACPNSAYMTFQEVADNGLPFTAQVVWYHYEDTSALPAMDDMATMVIGDFVQNGGSILTTGFTGSYLVDIGATTAGPSEIIDKDPAGPDAAWGVKPLNGKEAHPIFMGMTPTSDWADPNWGGFRTIGADVPGREPMNWWTGGAYPGQAIAVMPWWDANNSDIPIIGEFTAGQGGVMTCTAPGYHWVSANVNDAEAQGNLEDLTKNMLNYMFDPQPEPRLVVSGANGNTIVEGDEDGAVINVFAEYVDFVDPIDDSTWEILNLPPGVTVASVTRVDANNVSIVLAGPADDYDADISDFTIRIPAGQFVGLGGDFLESVGDILFDGIVEIDPSDVRLVLLGDKENMADLDPDEVAAYTWAMNLYPNAEYFHVNADAFAGADDLNKYEVAWWHYDRNIDLPLEFDNPLADIVMQNFYNSGGSLFLSGAATQYIVNTGATSKGPNQVGKPANPTIGNNDSWGFKAKDPNHPIFENLLNANGDFFTLNTPDSREDLLSLWNVDENFDPNIPPADRFDGIQLTSAEWDASFLVWASTAEFQGAGGGTAICVGAGSYDWDIPDGTNALQADLETYTFNILEYLGGRSTTDVKDLENKGVKVLAQPNPFSTEVFIKFHLEESLPINLEIFDSQGRLVERLLDGDQLPAGNSTQFWTPQGHPNGLYIYKVSSGDSVSFGKMILQR